MRPTTIGSPAHMPAPVVRWTVKTATDGWDLPIGCVTCLIPWIELRTLITISKNRTRQTQMPWHQWPSTGVFESLGSHFFLFAGALGKSRFKR